MTTEELVKLKKALEPCLSTAKVDIAVIDELIDTIERQAEAIRVLREALEFCSTCRNDLMTVPKAIEALAQTKEFGEFTYEQLRRAESGSYPL